MHHVTTGAEVLDVTGSAFDPATHDFDPTVEPVRPILTRAGLVRRRGAQNLGARARRPPAIAPVVVLPEREPGPSAPPPPGPAIASEDPTQPGAAVLLGEIGSDANDASAEAFAAVLVTSLSGAAVAIAGDWAEQTETEGEVQRVAWAAYLKTLDMSAPPAWSIPLLATLPWAARVARDERGPWNKRRRRRAALPPEPQPQAAAEPPPDAPSGPTSQFPADFDRSKLDA